MGCMRRKEGVPAAAHTYTVLLQPEPEGGYTVTCPALPGLVTYGASLEEARAMAADASRGYVECLREDGEPVPESDPARAPPREVALAALPRVFSRGG
jgi:predicted RNase H-like HicB family nuclease